MITAAIDSNVLSYFINASNHNYDPTKNQPDLAKEYIAIIQGYLYSGNPYILVPTVLNEYRKIPDTEKRKLHEIFGLTLFIDAVLNFDPEILAKRKQELLLKHPKENDCQILAEAEISDVDCLLTCDNSFLTNLSSQARGLLLMKPTEYVKRLNITPGQNPKLQPAPSNPLSNKLWWKL